jgi:hypothetical protein
MQRTQSKKKGAGRKAPHPGSSPMPKKPPQFESTITFGKTFRFSCAVSGTKAITRAQLLNLLVMNAVNLANYRLCDAVKIRRVRIWSNPPGVAQGAAPSAPVALQWLSEYGPTKVVSDSGMGFSDGAKISSKPPPMSLASFWCLTGTAEAVTLFELQVLEGDVIDIDLTFRLQNQAVLAGGAEVATVVTSTADGTAGVVYCLSLDLNTTASLPPVSYKTLV